MKWACLSEDLPHQEPLRERPTSIVPLVEILMLAVLISMPFCLRVLEKKIDALSRTSSKSAQELFRRDNSLLPIECCLLLFISNISSKRDIFIFNTCSRPTWWLANGWTNIATNPDIRCEYGRYCSQEGKSYIWRVWIRTSEFMRKNRSYTAV